MIERRRRPPPPPSFLNYPERLAVPLLRQSHDIADGVGLDGGHSGVHVTGVELVAAQEVELHHALESLEVGLLIDGELHVAVLDGHHHVGDQVETASVDPASQAFLVDHLGDDARALRLSEAFMKEVVANFDNDWELTGAEIDAALARLE